MSTMHDLPIDFKTRGQMPLGHMISRAIVLEGRPLDMHLCQASPDACSPCFIQLKEGERQGSLHDAGRLLTCFASLPGKF